MGVGGEFGKYYPKEHSTPTFFSFKYRRYIMAFKVKRKTVKKGAKLVADAVKRLPQVEAFRESLAKEPIEGIAKICYAAVRNRKRVEGALGLSLIPSDARDVAIDGQAVSDVTMSANMYMYRPPRKRVPDMMKFVMKRTVEDNIEGAANEQAVFDINMLDAKPVKDNPGNSSDYTPLSIGGAFGSFLEGRFRQNPTGAGGNDTYFTANTTQTSLHFKSLSSELTISNLHSTGLMLDIYELIPQFNIGPSTYSTSGGTKYATGYMSPTWTFGQGILHTDSTEDTMTNLSLGANPGNSTYFQRTWKVIKKVRVNMTGNSVHRHKSFYEINKTVSYPEWDQFSPDGGKFAGWNPTYMIVMRGTPNASSQSASTRVRYNCDLQLNYEASPDKQNKVIVYDANT